MSSKNGFLPTVLLLLCKGIVTLNSCKWSVLLFMPVNVMAVSCRTLFVCLSAAEENLPIFHSFIDSAGTHYFV